MNVSNLIEYLKTIKDQRARVFFEGGSGDLLPLRPKYLHECKIKAEVIESQPEDYIYYHPTSDTKGRSCLLISDNFGISKKKEDKK